MPSAAERLEPKLEAVLCRLCERLGELSVTQAVKIPYLVDLVANHILGEPITEGTHQTWKMGVVTREVWFYAQQGGHIHDPFIIKGSNQHPGGKRIYLGGEPDVELTGEQLEIIDVVADIWGGYDAKRLGRFTKALNTHLDSDIWGANQPASIDEDAFARLAAGWEAFNRRLPSLDFADRRHWGEPIEDPAEYLERELGA